MKWWCPLAVLVLISGCTSDGASPSATASTVQIAAPTTTSTTTAPPTTAPPTTSTTSAPTTTAATTTPSTTIPEDPVEAAKREVADRYEAFSVAANECVAVAAACDLPTVLGEFASPEAALYQLYLNRWEISVQNNEHSEHLDRIDRSIAKVQVDQDVTVLEACVKDGSVVLDATGEVVDDGIGYRREETFWHHEDGLWRLIGGTTYKLDQSGDATCQF